ncbi:MAG: undecaprenyldiphospho-muramoylpentapeptide beta-N-acetylglucosaminyltransferase, partial [Lysobacterales bacterium]
MSAPVMILAGGTGGHVFPGLAVAEALRLRGVPVVWLGGMRGIEQTLVPARGIELHRLPFGGVRGKSFATLLAAPWRLLRAVTIAMGLMRRLAPRAVISFGGYAAAPGGIAAWLSRRPLLVHEANRVPGTTNRLLALLARRVLTGFPQTFSERTQSEVTGNPVRAQIAEIAEPAQRLAGRSDPLCLLVLGGSQGARSLNAGVPAAVALNTPSRWQIRHQSGRGNASPVRDAYAAAGIEAEVTEFIDDMAAAYAWADVAICRAGALTLAEVTAAGVTSILVPFPHAVDDHQTANARYVTEAGAAELVAEGEGWVERLAAALRARLDDRAALLATAERARSLARPDATARIADLCLECAA